MIDEILSSAKVVKRAIIVSNDPGFYSEYPIRGEHGKSNLRVGVDRRIGDYFKINYDQNGMLLSRIELGGYHMNPPDDPGEEWSWLRKHQARKFKNQPHLHICSDTLRGNWAVPISETDFRYLSPWTVRLAEAYLIYCNISEYSSPERGLWNEP